MKTSAGLLLHKKVDGRTKVFLVHPGGPFFQNKDEGFWGIPKGEVNESEKLLDAAIRETLEETGIDVSLRKREEFMQLGMIKQKSGKIIHAWALEGEWPGILMCQSFCEVEWPMKSGKKLKIPEVDEAGFFDLDEAKKKLHISQWSFVERLNSGM